MLGAQSAEESAKSAEKPATPPKCLEAAVNPVTGYAVCVNPVGASVEAPPASSFHPCKSRPQHLSLARSQSYRDVVAVLAIASSATDMALTVASTS